MKNEKSFVSRLTGSRNFGLVVVLIIIIIIAAIITPSIFKPNTFIGMIQNNAVYGLLAVAEMLVIITGGIDISIGAILAFVGVVTTRYMSENMDVPSFVWVLVALAVGLLCGMVNGLLVGYLHIVPMIATLGTMYIYRGMAFLVSQGKWWMPHQITESYQNWAVKKIAGLPGIIWILILMFIIFGFFLAYTTYGRRIYAIGTSRESSAVAGIKDSVVIFRSMALCGMLAGLAGMLYTANYATCVYTIGSSYEMTAIAICVLGGVSITGGRGRMDGVVIAFILMSFITQFISLLPGLSVWSNAIQGAIIIGAVGLNFFTIHQAEKRALKERSELI
ncbi:MAG: ABC transporter permease [Lachnospiraceae bacterium]|nr:ABC transporter permease [Lachnospiraceae bacterium]